MSSRTASAEARAHDAKVALQPAVRQEGPTGRAACCARWRYPLSDVSSGRQDLVVALLRCCPSRVQRL
jgi:hypothetical protein